MFRPRVITALLLDGEILVKSVRFKKFKYIGDPINAVRLFNDLRADELVFLDIRASREGRTIRPEFVRTAGEEAAMPIAVGGGISSIQHIRELLAAGAEKVVINTSAGRDPDFVRRAADEFGSSTIVVCMDVKKKWLGTERVWISNGTKALGYEPVDYARLMQEKGAGELIVQSIERDGMMNGYDIELLRSISAAVSIPVIAMGGAGTIDDLREAYQEGTATAVAAGSMFVYRDRRRGVLINYPQKEEISF